MRYISAAAAALLLAMSAPASAQPAKVPGPLATVTKLYQESAGEAVIDSPELSVLDLFGRSKVAMARYLDDDLVALVMADRACSARTKEICNLDFSPIWDSQDPVGATVKLSAAKDASRVLAEVRYPGPENTVYRLTYVMRRTPAGWRIHDIEYDKHESLLAMLKGKS